MRKIWIRRLLVIISVLICICSCSVAEKNIVFRDIPWGTSLTEAKATLEKDDLYAVEVENMILGYEENYLDVYPSLNQTKVPTGHTLLSYTFITQVAGYDVEAITMIFRYGESGDIKALNNSRLSAASYSFRNIVDISGAYIDLKGKLDKLYGSSTETVDNDKGIMIQSDGNQEYKSEKRIAIWTDSLGAKVIMVCQTSDNKDALLTNYIYIVYLEPNYDENLAHTEALATQFAIEEENNNRTDNIDGL